MRIYWKRSFVEDLRGKKIFEKTDIWKDFEKQSLVVFGMENFVG